jgi:hypothetical protein
MTRLKESFDRSPLVSNSAIDSDCLAVFGDVQRNASTKLALFKEPADDVMESLNTQDKDVTASEGIVQSMASILS